ncbi:MAG: diphthamide synthesis protein [Candidatus Altiarchaeota archaeon]|nr:diphthamide synthesis protein [Candidatus Altiarchaeota archaeon]
MRVLHVPCYSRSDPLPALRKRIKEIGVFRSVGVVSTAQHLDRVKDVVKFLNDSGMKAYSGGQVLGCRQDAALDLESKVDCFLYMGSGRFHPIGIALKTGKPVYVLNPISNSFDVISEDEKKFWKRKNKARMMKAAGAESFGILVSTKAGQFKLKEAWVLKKRLESSGKRAFLFVGEELSPGNILPFKVDCWVNTACPRMTDDEYDKPVLNPVELDFLGL